MQSTMSHHDGSLTFRTGSSNGTSTQARLIPIVEAVAAPRRVSSTSPSKRRTKRSGDERSPTRRAGSPLLFVMPSQYSRFEIQLGEYVTRLLGLGELEMAPGFYVLLHQRSVAEWVVPLSAITLNDPQTLLSREDAPSIEELRALQPIGDSHPAGVYIGIIISPDGHHFTYVGSATSPGRGLKVRCDRQLDAAYRKTERASGTRSYHYDVVDQAGKGRVEHFRGLAETDFLLNEVEPSL